LQNFYGTALAQPLPTLVLKVVLTAYSANRKLCVEFEVASFNNYRNKYGVRVPNFIIA